MLFCIRLIVGQARLDALHASGEFPGVSLGYVLGMSVTYAVAGVAAGLTGTLLATTLMLSSVVTPQAVLATE